MNGEALWQAQRQLRQRLLDRPNTLHRQADRDLAAHLMLHLDDPGDCWRMAAAWLRDALDADRVDGGFGGPDDLLYTPQAECLRGSRALISVVGLPINARDCGVQNVWRTKGAVLMGNVEQERRVSPELRLQLLSLGTRVKLAAALFDADEPVGLLCADWTDSRDLSADACCARFEEAASRVLAPILGAARRLARPSNADGPPGRHGHAPAIRGLTPAELKVATLAARGLSYKEIARQLDRSLSTVDHQLRSVRDKLGAKSTARLVRMLNDERVPLN